MRIFILLAFCVTALQAADPPFPLRVDSDQRHLLSAPGVPVFIVGDSPWSLISGVTKEEAETYLEDRRRRGFNALIVNLIEHKFRGPENRYGEWPFVTHDDFSTPNEKYFAHADAILQNAAAKGFLIFLAPMYLGYKGMDEGWYEEALKNGPGKCRDYGTYVARRYKSLPNIVWMIGGDREPEAAWACHDEMAKAIRAESPQQLMTAHPSPEHTAAGSYGQGGWIDINTAYTYGIVHKQLIDTYRRKPPLPFVLAETTYEGEHNASALQIRRQAYWAILCGASGQFMGNRPLWLFDPGWDKALDSPASNDMMRLRALFLSRPWQDLEPDIDHELVTLGVGEHNGLDYLAAARSSDGSLLIAYMPDARQISVNLAKLSGPRLSIWWYNPRTGTALSSGTINRSGMRDFTPPGEGDWVFLLEDAAKNWPTPGSSPR